jgi:hypothetical protein
MFYNSSHRCHDFWLNASLPSNMYFITNYYLSINPSLVTWFVSCGQYCKTLLVVIYATSGVFPYDFV